MTAKHRHHVMVSMLGGPPMQCVYETYSGVAGAMAELEAKVRAGEPIVLGTDPYASGEARTFTMFVPGPGMRVSVIGAQTFEELRAEAEAQHQARNGGGRIVQARGAIPRH